MDVAEQVQNDQVKMGIVALDPSFRRDGVDVTTVTVCTVVSELANIAQIV